MSAFFHQLIPFIESSKYILLFIGTIFEGPVVMVASGFLWHFGELQFIPMYFVLLGGDFTADILWYMVGYFGARPLIAKYGRLINITPHMVEKVEEKFHTYQDRILLISKLTMGFGFALVTLIVAGILRVDFKRYATINLFGGFIWTFLLVSVGYFFGNMYALIPASLKIAFLCVGVIALVMILKKVKTYLASLPLV